MLIFSLIYTTFGDRLGNRFSFLTVSLTWEGEINEPTANPMAVRLLTGIHR